MSMSYMGPGDNRFGSVAEENDEFIIEISGLKLPKGVGREDGTLNGGGWQLGVHQGAAREPVRGQSTTDIESSGFFDLSSLYIYLGTQNAQNDAQAIAKAFSENGVNTKYSVSVSQLRGSDRTKVGGVEISDSTGQFIPGNLGQLVFNYDTLAHTAPNEDRNNLDRKEGKIN